MAMKTMQHAMMKWSSKYLPILVGNHMVDV
jgi:hypothetical protein